MNYILNTVLAEQDLIDFFKLYHVMKFLSEIKHKINIF